MPCPLITRLRPAKSQVLDVGHALLSVGVGVRGRGQFDESRAAEDPTAIGPEVDHG